MLVRNAFGLRLPLAAAIGGTIAMGIFRLPHEVATHLPEPTLFLGMWVVGAIFCVVAAAPVAELGASFPRSGGAYSYVRRGFGDFSGFLIGYIDWVNVTAGSALAAMVAGEYVTFALGQSVNLSTFYAIVMVIVITISHMRGPKETQLVQVAVTALKVAVFCAIVFGLGLFCPRQEAQSGELPTSTVGWATAFFLAFQAVSWTYSGWHAPIYFAGEVSEAGKIVPRAIFGTILTSAAVYFPMVLVLCACLPMTEISTRKEPFAHATELAFGSFGGIALAVAITAILVSAISTYTLCAPRVLDALATDNLFFQAAARVNKRGVPMFGLLLSSGLVILFLLSGSVRSVLAVLVFYDIVQFLMLILTVFILRSREPETPRPFKVWFHPWTTLLALLMTISFLVAAFVLDTWNSVAAVAIAGVGAMLYLLLPKRNSVQQS